MNNKLTQIVDRLLARLKRRRARIARYIELKRLSRIRKLSVPKYVHCKNCGEKLLGMYCHKCGQYALDVNQPFWKYINNFLENAYQFDGKILQTLRFLFTKPGFLSKEYVSGKVNSYVHPLKLYMFISIIFFSFVLTIYSSADYTNKVVVGVNAINNDSLKSKPKANNFDIDSTANLLNKDSIANKNADLSELKIKKDNQIKEFYTAVFNEIVKYTPFLVMLLMPVYALILFVSHKKRKKVYLHSFVFSIHIHTLFLILVTLISLLAPYCGVLLTKIIVPLFIIYNIIATKTFYERGWFISIIKSTLDLLVYGFVLLLCLLTGSILIIVSAAKQMDIF